jgi:uncharacterized protein YdaU (DUF1376 family)
MVDQKSDVWMALYIGVYLADTMHLARQHHGSYLLLIMAAFKNAGWLPNDDGLLAQIAKCTAKEWKAERSIYAAFFQTTDDRWTHKRVTVEWQKAQRLTEQRRAAGIESAAKRQRERNARSTGASTDGQRGVRPSERPSQSPSITPTSSVADSAQARATHTGWSAPIPSDWEPKDDALQRLRLGRPDLVGAYYDQRMIAFRSWCKSRAITSHDFEATWMGFMVQSHAAPNGAAKTGESFDQRRIREAREAVRDA